jgi:hypothetical protein
MPPQDDVSLRQEVDRTIDDGDLVERVIPGEPGDPPRPSCHKSSLTSSRHALGNGRLSRSCTHNGVTTDSQLLDKSCISCHRFIRRGGLEITMSGSALANRCRGRGTTVGTLRDPISPNDFSIAKIPAPLQRLILDLPASNRREAVSKISTGSAVGDVSSSNYRAFLFNKVLRFRQKGQRSSPQLVRISRGLLFGSSLVVKGDALIHGPTLVAQPVGSEWRTRHPFQVVIQPTN